MYRADRLLLNRRLLMTKVLIVLSMLLAFSNSSSAQSTALATCPTNIIKNNDPGQCGAIVNFEAIPVRADISITYPEKKPGAFFPVGSTDVIVIAEDGQFHSSTCTFKVTVKDAEAPTFINYQPKVAAVAEKGSCSAIVNYQLPTVSNNCPYQSKTFNYSGAPQTFTVPAGVTSLLVDMAGAQGGHESSSAGLPFGDPGWGGRVQATIPVTPLQVLTIYVGGVGKDGNATSAGAGGYNGGGNGGIAYGQYTGGGGGGASDIRTGAAGILDRIVVAGGGGGSGYSSGGGHGGDTIAANGDNPGTPAYGGGQTDSTGYGSIYSIYAGGNGHLGIGGNGVDSLTSGGGGGGYYGGGGGAMGDGGGGSSFTIPAATDVTHIQGNQQGDGFVTLTFAAPTALVPTAGLPSGARFPVGTTVNTFSATDAAGNTANCVIEVTVTDNEKPSITAPANIAVNADLGACSTSNVVLGTPITSDNCGVASVANNAPSAFNVGSKDVTWTVNDVHGNTSYAIQKVAVVDNQSPVISVPANVSAANAPANISIAMTATDNCRVDSFFYTISGSTTRSGSTADASGIFNAGTSYINWKVKDVNGNVATATTTVTVQAPQSIGVSVSDVWTVAPWGTSNTIYIGFGPSTLTLKAKAVSGTAPYRYEWTKNGSSTLLGRNDSLVVSAAGDYTIKVTDANGAIGTVTKKVNVMDVTCGTGGNKVAICHMPDGNVGNAKTICVSTNAVNSFLGNGNYLGDCTSSRGGNGTMVQNEAKVLKAYPNPTKGKFSIAANNEKVAKAEIVVVSVNGTTVQRRTVRLTEAHQLLQFDISNCTEGLYLLKIMTDKTVQTEKVLLKK